MTYCLDDGRVQDSDIFINVIGGLLSRRLLAERTRRFVRVCLTVFVDLIFLAPIWYICARDGFIAGRLAKFFRRVFFVFFREIYRAL